MNVPQWLDSMPQMVHASPNNIYGCPPGAVMLVPFPYMMDQNGQFIHYPCLVGQSQQVSSTPATNNFLMPQVSEVAAESDAAPTAHDGNPCEMAFDAKKLNADMPISDCLPDDLIGFGNPRQMLTDAGLASEVEQL